MIWTTNNWIKIKRVIRHKVNKDIYRVRTRDSVIDVTGDHSLIDINFDMLKPTECTIGET